jgi:BRCT domain type II-containing protein
VAGADVGKTKLDAAKKAGTQVIDEAALEAMIARTAVEEGATPANRETGEDGGA